MSKKIIIAILALAMFLAMALPCFASNCPVCSEEMYFDDMDGSYHCGYCGFVGDNADSYRCPNCIELGFLYIFEYDISGEPYLVSCNNCGYEGYYEMSLYVYCVNCGEASVEDYGGDYYCYSCGASWCNCPNCDGAIVHSISPYCTECFKDMNGDYHPAYNLGYQTGKNEQQSGTVDEETLNAIKQEQYDKGYTDGLNNKFDSFEKPKNPMTSWEYIAITATYNLNGESQVRNFNRVYYRQNMEAEYQAYMLSDKSEFSVSNMIDIISAEAFTFATGSGVHYAQIRTLSVSISYSKEAAFVSKAFFYRTTGSYIGGITYEFFDTDNTLRCSVQSGALNNAQYSHVATVDGVFNVQSVTLRLTDVDELEHAISFGIFPDSGYDLGYYTGFQNGLITTNEKVYNDGYDSGYAVGFRAGKTEGLTISEKGTFGGLIASVVEAPVNAFQSLFNFEILGVNMQSFVGSLLMLCVLIIILKKVF